MKKIVLILMILLTFTACGNYSSSESNNTTSNDYISSSEIQPLDYSYENVEEYNEEDKDYQMKKDYWSNYALKGNDIGKIFINEDYGTYSNSRIVKICGQSQVFTEAKTYEKVNQRLFIHNNSQQFKVYNGNKFYTLKEAFEQEFVDKDDVDELYKAYYGYSYDEVNISNLEHDYNLETNEKDEGLYSSTSVQINYGRYDTSLVAIICNSFELDDNSSKNEETIASYTFKYNNDNKITVYNDHKFYDLKTAFELNLLSSDDISDIYDLHQEKYVDIYM